MTTKTASPEASHYKKLREIIIEAMPGIVELKKGCEVGCDGYENDNMRILSGMKGIVVSRNAIFDGKPKDNKTGEWLRMFIDTGVPIKEIKKNKSFVILGRSIRLADVLIAIREKDKELKKDKSYEFNSHVLDPDISIAIDDLVNIHWNLKTNTLKDQSPELYAFLWELLGEGE